MGNMFFKNLAGIKDWDIKTKLGMSLKSSGNKIVTDTDGVLRNLDKMTPGQLAAMVAEYAEQVTSLNERVKRVENGFAAMGVMVVTIIDTLEKNEFAPDKDVMQEFEHIYKQTRQ